MIIITEAEMSAIQQRAQLRMHLKTKLVIAELDKEIKFLNK